MHVVSYGSDVRCDISTEVAELLNCPDGGIFACSIT